MQIYNLKIPLKKNDTSSYTINCGCEHKGKVWKLT